jgi:tetrahydromethanopterin S-methyltransferase subunit G
MKLDNLTEKLSDGNSAHSNIHAVLNKRLDELERKVEDIETSQTQMYGAIANARKSTK